MHGLTVSGGEWGKTGSLKNEFGECPGTCREEVVGIIGGGELGESTLEMWLLVFLQALTWRGVLRSLTVLYSTS